MNFIDTEKSHEIAATLIASISLSEQKYGGSYNLDLEQPVTGYMVSLGGKKHTLEYETLSKVDVHAVAAWVKSHVDVLGTTYFGQPLYLGSWYDQSTGKVFFDLSVNESDKAHALSEAVIWKQLAIYDVENKQIIRL